MTHPSSPSSSHCPVCHNLSQKAFEPFCSSGCKMVDLHRWFNGYYAIPDQENAFTEDEEVTQAPLFNEDSKK